MQSQPMEQMLSAALLVMLRLSSALVTLPVFSSPAIPARVKALLVLTVTAVVTPGAAFMPGAAQTLSVPGLLGEIVLGLCFGVTVGLLMESVLFCGSIMSGAFSFSLANLIDPNSHVETDVLSTLLNWMSVLVLLAAGLHRTMIAALLRTFVTIPVGTFVASASAPKGLITLASGVFFCGLQLSAPVLAAALMVEIAIGLLGRMAPALPGQIASVPVKTMVSYSVLLGSLALWPGWLEQHFNLLLAAATNGRVR